MFLTRHTVKRLNINKSQLLFSTAPASYPNLLKPLDLGNNIVLRNRVLMGSMHTNLEEGFSLFGTKGLDEMACKISY